MRSKIVLLIALVTAALAARSLCGQADVEPQAVPKPELSYRQYDISTLLQPAPDLRFPEFMDMGEPSYGPPGSAFQYDPLGGYAENGVERLRTMIERTVRSEEPWESMGGRASLDFYERSRTLIISQTPLGHALVSELLRKFLAERSRTVFITVQAVELDAAFRDELFDQGNLIARTDQEKARLRAAIKRTYARMTLSGSQGQSLCGNSGRIQSYMADLEPIVCECHVGWKMETQHIPNGLAVNVRPTVTPTGDAVRLDYLFCYARLKDMRRVAARMGEGLAILPPMGATLDLPTCDADQRAGTVVLPLRSPAVIGGGTVPMRLVTGQADDTGVVELDYIVTVRMTQTVAPPGTF